MGHDFMECKNGVCIILFSRFLPDFSAPLLPSHGRHSVTGGACEGWGGNEGRGSNMGMRETQPGVYAGRYHFSSQLPLFGGTNHNESTRLY